MTDRRRLRELPAWAVVAVAAVVALLALVLLMVVRSHRTTADDDGRRSSPYPVLAAPDSIGTFLRVENADVNSRADHAVQVLDDPSNYSSLYAEYQGPAGAYLTVDAALPVSADGLEQLEGAEPDTLRAYLTGKGFADPVAFDPGPLGGHLACSTHGAGVSPGDVACGWVDRFGVAVLIVRSDGIDPPTAAAAARAVRAEMTPDDAGSQPSDPARPSDPAQPTGSPESSPATD